MELDRYMRMIYVLIYLLFLGIARTAALARNFQNLGTLSLPAHEYHETPLHNVGDVADLGVESNGSRNDMMHELTEILEDESQSPDEQSASKYEENVKVFENPVVLEATSNPTDDEVKDFQKVSDHEKATEDNHFDSLTKLLKKSGLFGLNKFKSPMDNVSEVNNNHHVEDKDYVENNKLKLNHLKGGLGGLNPQSNMDGANGFAAALNPDVLKNLKLPPVTVHGTTHNNFHVVNVHHHHPQGKGDLAFDVIGSNTNDLKRFASRECFEGKFGKICYCSKEQTCRCTKTFVMLTSVCDTLLNDPQLKEFCSHYGVKNDHPNLNHRFSKSQDSFVWDAFKTVQDGLCNTKSLTFCQHVIKMEKTCQCTRCD